METSPLLDDSREATMASLFRSPLLRSLAALVLACVAGSARADPAFVIGSKKFTESYVLGAIAQHLLTRAGIAAEHRAGMGGTAILWQALLHGDIDAYPEYTGTISEQILKTAGGADIASLRKALLPMGIGVTDDLGFEDGYALVMTRRRAAELRIATISDLRRHPELRAGPTPEFLARRDGWGPLVARYGLSFASVQGIEHALGYAALVNGEIDLKDCYTTDARTDEYNLLLLDDDLHFFPRYRGVFLYRLAAQARGIAVLATLSGTLSQARMAALNRKAEQAKDYTAAVAEYFSQGTIRPPATGWSRIRSYLEPLPRLTAEHAMLVSVSLLAAIIVSIPLGILAARPGVLSLAILGIAGMLQTIPSLALLALMIPAFGIGRPPAIAALFLYSLLPIVRGTATGMQTVATSLGQAAAALGLRRTTQLIFIDLPLASPSILAGVKTSAVINVGTATLAGLVGGGGYGEPIQSGLQLNDDATILQGAIPAAILAFLVQVVFSGLERIVVPKGLRLRKRSGASALQG